MRYVPTSSKPIVLATLLCSIALPYAKGETPYTPQAKEYLRKLDEPILLRGDYFKATMVAYHDFLKTMLASNAAMANIYARNGYKDASAGDQELYTKLSKIKNFDISIEQSESLYTVDIGPTLRGDMPIVFGGGAVYQIDKKTFSIKSKMLTK